MQRFVDTAHGSIHYRRAGSGPPVVVVHASPFNKEFLADMMGRLARDFTCFVITAPGYGLSDAVDDMSVPGVADALAAGMAALGLEAVPVFGSNTAAAIALELGVRHPERVSGLFLESIAFINAEEAAPILAHYHVPLEPDPYGGHFSSYWTRFRDRFIWYPYFTRTVEHLGKGYGMQPPEIIQSWLMDFFDFGNSTKRLYDSVAGHGEANAGLIDTLQTPAIFTAPMGAANPVAFLHRHPPLKPQHRLEAQSSDVIEAVRLAFHEFGGQALAPPEPASAAAPPRVVRRFVDVGEGEAMVRVAGGPSSPALVILHDLPGAVLGSGLQLEPLMRELARDHYVVVPDLPGTGETFALAEGADLDAAVAALSRILEAAGLNDDFTLYGIGSGASLAAAFAAGSDWRGRLIVQGPFLHSDEWTGLVERILPQIVPVADGSHLYRAWLRRRDALIYWLADEPLTGNLRRVEADFGGPALHQMAVEAVRRSETNRQVARLALGADLRAALAGLRETPALLSDAASPFSRWDSEFLAIHPGAHRAGDAGRFASPAEHADLVRALEA